MSRDVLTVGSTMRIPLLYRGEYSQWVERFMNYLEEQTDGEAMINSIKNEKRIQKIDRLTRSLLIQGLPNDIYSLIDSNKTAKDLCDAFARHMLGSEYGEQDRKAAVLYEYETFKATEGELLLDTYIRYLQVINDLKKCGYSKDKRDVNDAMGSKKKTVVVTSDPLALIGEKTKVSKSKDKVVVSSDSEGSGSDDFSELKKITALLAKAFNQRKLYSKPTNNNLRTSSTSQSANKKQEFDKTDNKRVEKKDDEEKRDMIRVKCYNCKKEGHFAKDCKKVKVKDYEYYKTNMLLAKKDKDEQVLLTEDQAWMESSTVPLDGLHFDEEPVEIMDRKVKTVEAKPNPISQEFVKTDNKRVEKKDDEKKRDMIKVKCYNCKKEGHFAKDCKKVKVKDYEYYKTKMLLAKKDKDEQVLFAKDQAWMESSKASLSSADEKIFEVSYYLSESEKIFHDAIDSASENFIENHIDSQKDYDKSDVDHNDYEEKDHLVDKLIRKFNKKIVKCQKWVEKAIQQSKKFENQNKDLQDIYDVLKNQTTTFEMNNNELNEQIKELIEKNNDLLAQTKVLKDQLQVKHVVIDTHIEYQEKYAKLEAERYEYMIRDSAYFDNDKQHRKQIADQQVLHDKMSVQLVELDKHVRDLKNTVLEKDFKIFELEECVRNKDLEIKKYLERLNVYENKLHKMGQINQTVHMIMPSKDNLYNGRKGIGFENPRYFEKAKDLRPTLYDEKVIGLGYTPMFLTHSDEALEIEKFKISRENKIEFAYDYGNLNASYVNEKINFEDHYFQDIINPDFKKIDSPFQQTSSLKPYVTYVILEKIIIDLEDEVINFEDDYFQEIINPDFKKIDSLYQQTSSLKPYVPNVILEKIIIDLEDEVVNLLEKEKCNPHGSGISLLLAVGTFFTGSGNFFCQWELYNWQWECLVHFILNNPPLNLMLQLHSSF
uniref:CCHC-type domain-containing protein n=1 Tax=Tanacetum cinerariifolium TaxID=118510 RepID=A0A6L2NXP8_TANCI|nr:hypothetical protein [Tanacetum cinerariifolium]